MEKSIKRPDFYILADYLRSLRELAGWTQVAFSKALGKNQTFVSSYEQGYRRLDALQLEEVFSQFGLSMVTGWRNFDRLRARQKVPKDWKPPVRSKRPRPEGRLRVDRSKRSG